jgi:hypothetical protein
MRPCIPLVIEFNATKRLILKQFELGIGIVFSRLNLPFLYYLRIDINPSNFKQ